MIDDSLEIILSPLILKNITVQLFFITLTLISNQPMMPAGNKTTLQTYD